MAQINKSAHARPPQSTEHKANCELLKTVTAKKFHAESIFFYTFWGKMRSHPVRGINLLGSAGVRMRVKRPWNKRRATAAGGKAAAGTDYDDNY